MKTDYMIKSLLTMLVFAIIWAFCMVLLEDVKYSHAMGIMGGIGILTKGMYDLIINHNPH
jgi:4-amino-4-deoxy-L-arabinose transferase-like glycosyltransferase